MKKEEISDPSKVLADIDDGGDGGGGGDGDGGGGDGGDGGEDLRVRTLRVGGEWACKAPVDRWCIPGGPYWGGVSSSKKCFCKTKYQKC